MHVSNQYRDNYLLLIFGSEHRPLNNEDNLRPDNVTCRTYSLAHDNVDTCQRGYLYKTVSWSASFLTFTRRIVPRSTVHCLSETEDDIFRTPRLTSILIARKAWFQLKVELQSVEIDAEFAQFLNRAKNISNSQTAITLPNKLISQIMSLVESFLHLR